MNVNYVSSNDLTKAVVYVDNQYYKIPDITIACVKQNATINNYKVQDYKTSVEVIQKQIMKVFDHPDLDDAVELIVTYEGENFHNCVNYKEGITYGSYGFKALYWKRPCKIAYLSINSAIEFVDPTDIIDKLQKV